MIDLDDGADARREAVELSRAEALGLLAGTPMGRVVYTRNALPAIRPVNHLVDEDGLIVFRTRLGSSIVTGRSPVVVTYGADEIDPRRRVGWSVSVTGLARIVGDPSRVQRYRQRLQPWVQGGMDTVITIDPDIVSGIRLLARPSAPSDQHSGLHVGQ